MPHGRGYSELDDPCHRQGQAFVVVEAAEEAVQLVRAWAAVPICALAEKAKPLERGKHGGLAAPGRFPYLAHFGYMKIDELAKGREAGNGCACRRQPLIHPGLRLGWAQRWASSRRRNVSLAWATFASDLGPAGTGGAFGDGGRFRVRLMCALSHRRGANSEVSGRIPAKQCPDPTV